MNYLPSAKPLTLATVMVAALVTACSGSPRIDEEAAHDVQMSGEDAYEAQCAGCHETGLNGAPVVGDKAYWESRSKLWHSVLVDHAKTGYLDMPPRGGRQDLSDATIEAAVDYMLSLTYPEMPRDQ